MVSENPYFSLKSLKAVDAKMLKLTKFKMDIPFIGNQKVVATLIPGTNCLV